MRLYTAKVMATSQAAFTRVKAEAKALIKAGKVCHSYYYEGDRSLKRWVHYKKNQFHYFEKYKRYFGNKGLRD